MAGSGNSQPPRKFTEKIAQLTKNENEANRKFEEIMMEVVAARHPPPAAAAYPGQPVWGGGRVGNGGGMYPGAGAGAAGGRPAQYPPHPTPESLAAGPGSLPNLRHAMQNAPGLPPTLMAPTAEDGGQMGRSSLARSHHHRATPYHIPSRAPMEQQQSVPCSYLPVPPAGDWKRFKSDSDLLTSSGPPPPHNGPKSAAPDGQANAFSPPMNKRLSELLLKEPHWEQGGGTPRAKSLSDVPPSPGPANLTEQLLNGNPVNGVLGGSGGGLAHPHMRLQHPHGGGMPMGPGGAGPMLSPHPVHPALGMHPTSLHHGGGSSHQLHQVPGGAGVVMGVAGACSGSLPNLRDIPRTGGPMGPGGPGVTSHQYSQPLASLLTAGSNDPMMGHPGGPAQTPSPGGTGPSAGPGGAYDKFVDTTMPPPDSPQQRSAGGPQSPLLTSPPPLMPHTGPMGPPFQPHPKTSSAIKEKLQQQIALRHHRQAVLLNQPYRSSAPDPITCPSPTSPATAAGSQVAAGSTPPLRSPDGTSSDVFSPDAIFQHPHLPTPQQQQQQQQQQQHPHPPHHMQQQYLSQRLEQIKMDNQQPGSMAVAGGGPGVRDPVDSMYIPGGGQPSHHMVLPPMTMASSISLGNQPSRDIMFATGDSGQLSMNEGGSLSDGGVTGDLPYGLQLEGLPGNSFFLNNSNSKRVIPNIVLTPEADMYRDYDPLGHASSPSERGMGTGVSTADAPDTEFLADKLDPINEADLQMLNDPRFVTDSSTEDKLRQDSSLYSC